jgi:hypothetical protein
MTEEQRLIEKLRRVDALHSRAASDGERVAAGEAARRLNERLEDLRAREPIEYKFSLADEWSRALFIALLRRHGIVPYRYSGQRRTTVMARAPRELVDHDLWPEFKTLRQTLHAHLSEVTNRVIAAAIHGDVSEPEVRSKREGLLGSGSAEHG